MALLKVAVPCDEAAGIEISFCRAPGMGKGAVAETGQMVVRSNLVSVVTEPISAGQLVIVGAQDVIV